MNAVELHRVHKRFGQREVLHDVTLCVAQGERLVLSGASGCGKTTLLRIIAGLELIDAGAVDLNGARAGEAGRNLIEPEARGIGFVFQDLALWPHMTVIQHLAFVLRYGQVARSDWPARVQRILALTRLEELAQRKPHALSGGQQQRLALARALITEPPLVLMDEPLSSLDEKLKAHLESEILHLHAVLGFTLLYVTHDREEAAAIGTRIIAMREGRIEP